MCLHALLKLEGLNLLAKNFCNPTEIQTKRFLGCSMMEDISIFEICIFNIRLSDNWWGKP